MSKSVFQWIALHVAVVAACSSGLESGKRTAKSPASIGGASLTSLVRIKADKSVSQLLTVGSALDPVTLSLESGAQASFSIVEQNCAGFYTLTGALLSSIPMTSSSQGCYARVRATSLGHATSELVVDVMLQSKGQYLSSGYFHSCAINNSGELLCWGDNSFQQKTAPSGVFSGVAAGKYHSCAIEKSTSLVQCWGAGSATSATGVYPHFGQSTPPANFKAVAIAAGGYHTCAITTSGYVQCWGAGTGRSYDGSMPHLGQSNAPGILARSVSAGEFHTCAVAQDFSVKCWGAGASERRSGYDVQQSFPPAGLGGALFVAAGARHSCATLRTGDVACWGENSMGQAPSAASSFGAPVQSISAGQLHTCVVLASGGGDVRCFGAGASSSSFPNFGQAVSQSGMMGVAAGAFHTCGLSLAGVVNCWGVLAAADSFYGKGQAVSPSPSVTVP